jgi:hypothetical protein
MASRLRFIQIQRSKRAPRGPTTRPDAATPTTSRPCPELPPCSSSTSSANGHRRPSHQHSAGGRTAAAESFYLWRKSRGGWRRGAAREQGHGRRRTRSR